MKLLILMILLVCLEGCTLSEKIPKILQERQDNAVSDLEYLYSMVQLPDHPLTLEEIVDIAWQNNWDALTEELDWETQRLTATSQLLQMLPSLALSGEASDRNKSTAQVALIPSTGIITQPAIGSSKEVRIWDATFTFRLIDFSLAYFRSQAQQWRALGAYTQYARIKQNVILDVYRAYWRAITAQWAMERAGAMLATINEFIEKFEKNIALRNLSSVPALKLEDQLRSFQLQFYNFDLAYASGKAELAHLMGIPADVNFELAPVEMKAMPAIDNIDELEKLAMENRPELFGTDFEENLSAEQVREAIVLLFPTLEYFRSYQNNFDRFLIHHHWIVTGIRAAWDLLSLPSKKVNVDAAKSNRLRAYTARLALSIAVLSQVNIAYNNYLTGSRLYEIAAGISQVRDRLSDATEMEFIEGEFNEVEAVLAKANALEAEIQYIRSYGDMQIALEELNNSIGLPIRYNTLSFEYCKNE